MVVLIILLVLIALVFFVPYGVDAAYEDGRASLSVRAGPVSVRLLPRKPQTERQKEKARRKKEKKEAKAAAKKAKKEEKPSEETAQTKDETLKVKKERQLDPETLMALLEMGVHALGRLFRSFKVDYFKLHCSVAGRDPYNTAMVYGYLCSAVEGLPALTGNAVTRYRRDIALDADFTAEKPLIDVRIIITLQLFRIVHLAFAFGTEYIIWAIRRRREKKAAALEEKEQENGRQQDQ